ncbi:salivary peroxidase/catechol oxidase-like isoform X2 [Antedon mediterranea]|uniref:salivary peroxidase/catechol oxidase-like isoform X2 n=1 Tax=Antedon mediterranea TaxID=105859 RepID=UPI003AF6C87A
MAQEFLYNKELQLYASVASIRIGKRLADADDDDPEEEIENQRKSQKRHKFWLIIVFIFILFTGVAAITSVIIFILNSDGSGSSSSAKPNVTTIVPEFTLLCSCKGRVGSTCSSEGYNTNINDCPTFFHKYRTYDGSCNNVCNPSIGKSHTPPRRILPPVYSDEKASPRLSAAEEELPNVRNVSVHFSHEENFNINCKYTDLVMHFGQLLDHDMDHSVPEEVPCGCNRTDKCLPIPIPKDDPYFTKPCMVFKRSQRTAVEGCPSAPTEHVNVITSYIDGSFVYGSTEHEAKKLRSFVSGKLIVLKNPSGSHLKPILPHNPTHSKCKAQTIVKKCPSAGDKRASVQPGLHALHTVFVREHNRLTDKLTILNPHWNDERLFQEARKIVSAVFQHITYSEYLPVILGQKSVQRHNLATDSTYAYSDCIDPSISSVFSSAAFRFGHSQIGSFVARADKNYQPTYDPLPLRGTFFNASVLDDARAGGVDSIILGMLSIGLFNVDYQFSKDITEHLFSDPPNAPGMDLLAINILRGRDHGLASYNDWRDVCGLGKADTFADLTEISKEVQLLLQKIYQNVNDIDAIIGMFSERHVDGALVGPTFSCILGEQFHNLKFGDRFWYENTEGHQAFSKTQLETIRTSSLARLFCDNLDEIETVQPHVFIVPDNGFEIGKWKESVLPEGLVEIYTDDQFSYAYNSRVPCSSATIPSINLNAWKEII